MKVKVIAKGFYEGRLWSPGDVLNVDDDFSAKWVVPIVEETPVAAEEKTVETDEEPVAKTKKVRKKKAPVHYKGGSD